MSRQDVHALHACSPNLKRFHVLGHRSPASSHFPKEKKSKIPAHASSLPLNAIHFISTCLYSSN